MLRYSDADELPAPGRACRELRARRTRCHRPDRPRRPRSRRAAWAWPDHRPDARSSATRRPRRSPVRSAPGHRSGVSGSSVTSSTRRPPAAPLVAYASLTDAVSLKVTVLFVWSAPPLLWPTHRRGRHVVTPASGPPVGDHPTGSDWPRGHLGPGDAVAVPRAVPTEPFIDVVAVLQIVPVHPAAGHALGRLIRPAHGHRLQPGLRPRRRPSSSAPGPVGQSVALGPWSRTPASGSSPRVRRDRMTTRTTCRWRGDPRDLPEIPVLTRRPPRRPASVPHRRPELVRIVRRCPDGVTVLSRPRLFGARVNTRERRSRGRRILLVLRRPPACVPHVAGQAGLRRHLLGTPPAVAPVMLGVRGGVVRALQPGPGLCFRQVRHQAAVLRDPQFRPP